MYLDKNVGVIDRLYRALFGIMLLLIAFFWIGGILRIILYIIAIVLLANAVTGFCLIYKVLGISTYIKLKDSQYDEKKKWMVIGAICFLLIGSIGSHFITKNNFLKDFGRINKDYKSLLLSASGGNRAQATADYERLAKDYEEFYEKYSIYQPFVVRQDKDFKRDIEKIRAFIDDSRHKIIYGNITAGYASLESIRPVINDLRRRNKLEGDRAAFSDFYGPMQILIEAAEAGDIQEVERAYLIADERLKYIESFMNNSEVELIRINLDSVYSLAKKGEVEKLPARTAELESRYLSAYLEAG